MSGKIMGQVYDRVLPARQQAVLLALADHADHDGANAWCAVGKMAHKLGCSTRTIHYRLRELEAAGVLIRCGSRRDAEGRSGAIVYRILLEALPRKGDYVPVRKNCTPGLGAPGVQKTPSRCAEKAIPVCKQVAHKPSIKPSIKPASLARLAAVQQAGGYLDYHKSDERPNWLIATEGDDLALIIDVLTVARLPNGKRIRLPSGYITARDRRLVGFAAAAKAKAGIQADRASAKAIAEHEARVYREDTLRLLRISTAFAANDLPRGQPPEHLAAVWESFGAAIRKNVSPGLTVPRLKAEWPAFRTWFDRLMKGNP